METVLLTNIKKLYDNELYSSVITAVSKEKAKIYNTSSRQRQLIVDCVFFFAILG